MLGRKNRILQATTNLLFNFSLKSDAESWTKSNVCYILIHDNIKFLLYSLLFLILNDLEKMRTQRRIFFLGGIHGVGKGTLCKSFSASLNIECLTASKLINWAELNEDPKNKSVSNIGFTQERLIVALNAYCEENRNYVLDGHFCLLDKNNEPVGIPEEVFIKINPEVLLLITAPVQIIKQRLEKRDSKSYDEGSIEKMQEFEISHARSISNLLDRELKIFSYEKSDSLIKYLNTIL